MTSFVDAPVDDFRKNSRQPLCNFHEVSNIGESPEHIELTLIVREMYCNISRGGGETAKEIVGTFEELTCCSEPATQSVYSVVSRSNAFLRGSA